MGANSSLPAKMPLRDYTASDVASCVKEMGEKYETYAETIESSRIDGAFLTSLTRETFEETLDCLQITKRLHRRKLERVLGKALTEQRRMGVSDSISFTLDTALSDSSTSSLEGEITMKHRPSDHTQRTHESDSSRTPSLGSSASGHRTSTSSTSRQKHRRSPSDVPVEMVMECALAANEIDNLLPGPSMVHVPAVLEAAIAAQAVENQNLQHDVLQLETERKIESAPEGTVAIVLTDIEGSTSLWEANPEAMRTALALHDSIQRQLREEHFGYEIDTEGDAFFLAFSEPCDALAFALDLQLALNEAPWSEEILSNKWGCDDGERRGLKVRISVHMGPVDTLKNPVTGRVEYDGEGMEVAQAVEKMTRGGQILTTMDTWNAAFHLADAKLGSPTVQEFNKPLVMTEKDVSMDISVRSTSHRRLVELTHASLSPLTDATIKDASTPRRPNGLIRRRSQLFRTLASAARLTGCSPSPSIVRDTTAIKA